MVTSSDSELVDRVTTRTIKRDVDRETWEQAVAIQGLLAVNNSQAHETAKRWIEHAVRTQDSFGQLGYNDTQVLSHGHVVNELITPTSLSAALGYQVLGRWQEDNDATYMQAALRQADAIMVAPRTNDGGISLRTQVVELWIDTVYMVCPFLSRLGQITGETKWADECLLQLHVHIDRLVDDRNQLARHVWRETPNTYPQSSFWSRGNGWLTVAIVDSVAVADTAANFSKPVRTLNSVLDRVVALQDRSGLWRDVLDDTTSRLEVSGSLMFAYSIARGVKQAIVSKDYIEVATRAFQAAALAVDEDGTVRGVTVPPGGPAVPFGETSYGQGFFLLAYAALADIGALPDFEVTG